jgi:ATP-dependent protease ClpP protease subunit
MEIFMRLFLFCLLLLPSSCATIPVPEDKPATVPQTVEEKLAAIPLHSERMFFPPGSAPAKPKAPAKEEFNSDEAVMLDVTDIDDEHVGPLIKRMNELKSKGFKKLWLRINSDGGGVVAGWDLVQAIEGYGSPVTCVVDTRAQSMGFYILQTCDKRLMTSRSFLMAHEPQTQVRGNANTLRDYADKLDAMHEGFINQCLTRMKVSREEFIAKTRDRVWNMGFAEAKKVNAIDGEISPKKLPRLMKIEPPQNLLQLLLGGMLNK